MDIQDLPRELLAVRNLGERTIPSPLGRLFDKEESARVFFTDDFRIAVDHRLESIRKNIAHKQGIPCFEAAGPRSRIFFDPASTTCAIVTCGGLCPGLNDVIRSIVLQAYYRYGVRRILGIPYGFEGLIPSYGHKLIELTPEYVSTIHTFGGTCLGTSRGPQDVGKMVDRLAELGVNVFFVIGGDGTQRAGLAICEEALRRGLQ
ncbi:MAG: 6-phosphofructokinase, partial [Terrimicrobiaceae bacterium]|nr:6-phosphofructokinase [Terrimicrobiaceae bacterium]